MMRWLLGIGVVVALLGGVGTVHAEYENGQRAWDAGRYSEALREWQAAANAGDGKAMLALGRLYKQGLGAPQDYVKAHLWFNLAASRGEAEAVTERDALAACMAPEQIAEAQQQASAWQPHTAQTPAASESAGPPPSKAIREAQELLAALGYKPDPPDGRWGERTVQAYQAFVRDANLPKTDILTPTALKTMRTIVRQAGSVDTSKPKAILPPDALHRAAKAGNLKGLEAALAAGSDVNARDDKGWTALMYAVDKSNVLLVEPLLQAKAAPAIKGPLGKTATEIAQARYGDFRMALKKGEPPAIIALLAGKLLAEAEEMVRAWREKPPGFIFRDCDRCPELIVVPTGRFRMGDLNSDSGSDEKPVHNVEIAYPLAIGKYEVTFAEWDACVAASGCTHQPDDEGWGRGTRPVINVSWEDAQEYVRWLSRETGQPYRLLSEAEWEYVARAGTTTKYRWGNKASHDHANYGKNECCGGIAAGKDRWVNTSPVGGFEPNAFGLYDTAGNVWEWVEDCWNENYNGAPGDGSAWTSGNCDVRVVRGGSWSVKPRILRSAFRYRFISGYRNSNFGFRVARTLD